jgi:hypothetical protein
MACSPVQDQFIWPLNTIEINRVVDDHIRLDWSDPDYQSEDEEEEEETVMAPSKVTVVQKIRYFLSEKQAQDFFDSCW